MSSLAEVIESLANSRLYYGAICEEAAQLAGVGEHELPPFRVILGVLDHHRHDRDLELSSAEYRELSKINTAAKCRVAAAEAKAGVQTRAGREQQARTVGEHQGVEETRIREQVAEARREERETYERILQEARDCVAADLEETTVPEVDDDEITLGDVDSVTDLEEYADYYEYQEHYERNDYEDDEENDEEVDEEDSEEDELGDDVDAHGEE